MANRNDVIKVMQGWVGAVQGGSIHKHIVDTYNTIKGVPRMNYTAAYCATTTSAAYKSVGLDNIYPCHYSCGEQIKLAQKMGIWVENDAYRPSTADGIIYAWTDANPASDNTTGHDHTGLVEKVVGNTITVIEGNMGSAHKVGRRTVSINGKNIRGFIVPNFPKESVILPQTIITTTHRTIKMGSRNSDVLLLHQILWQKGYGVDKNSDNFTDLTRTCVMHFQAVHALEIDGIVGQKTWKALGE